MAKMYKSYCRKHDKCELSSRVGEDLTDFKQRMIKQGHEVGELFNSDYRLSERGYKLLSELLNLLLVNKDESQVSKIANELDKEFELIKGFVDHSGTPILNAK